jgi:hypothetical protein
MVVGIGEQSSPHEFPQAPERGVALPLIEVDPLFGRYTLIVEPVESPVPAADHNVGRCFTASPR